MVIEDDAAIADLLEMYLRRAGFRPLVGGTGERGLELVAAHDPAAVLLDVGLPGIDGFQVIGELRRRDVPVLFITARDAEADRIAGLELGADDYIDKPFSPGEVVARVRTILRRAGTTRHRASVVVLGNGIEVDLDGHDVRRAGVAISLAPREFELLAHLSAHRGRALTRRQLIDGVWGFDFDGDERTVDVHVRQLRRKLGDGLPLATVWGVGYRMD